MNSVIDHLLSAAVGLAVLLLQRFVLSNRPQVWLGAILPAVLIAALIFLGVQGRVDDARSWILFTLGLVGLLGIWGDGRAARKKRLQRENERIDAIHAQGAANHQL